MKRFLFVLFATLALVVHGNEDIHTINLINVENPRELSVAISTILFNEIYGSALIANEHLRRFHEITRDWERARRLDWFADRPDPYSINDLIEDLRRWEDVQIGNIPPANSLATIDDRDIPHVQSGSASPESPASPNATSLISRPAMRHGATVSFTLGWGGGSREN